MTVGDLGYPTNAEEWTVAIEEGVGLAPAAGRRSLREGGLPEAEILDWLARAFSPERGFTPLFLAAVQRNLGGLLKWVYGDGGEPYWPGSDTSPGP